MGTAPAGMSSWEVGQLFKPYCSSQEGKGLEWVTAYTVDSEALPHSAKPASHVLWLSAALKGSKWMRSITEIFFRRIPQRPCEDESRGGEPASLPQLQGPRDCTQSQPPSAPGPQELYTKLKGCWILYGKLSQPSARNNRAIVQHMHSCFSVFIALCHRPISFICLMAPPNN